MPWRYCGCKTITEEVDLESGMGSYGTTTRQREIVCDGHKQPVGSKAYKEAEERQREGERKDRERQKAREQEKFIQELQEKERRLRKKEDDKIQNMKDEIESLRKQGEECFFRARDMQKRVTEEAAKIEADRAERRKQFQIFPDSD